jgi:hypothetical protein
MKTAILYMASRPLVEQLVGSGVETIIYRKTDDPALPQQFPAVRWIDYSADLAEGIRFGYLDVRARLEKLRKRSPGFFIVNGYDFFEALNKDIFWGEFDELLFKFWLSKLPDAKLIHDERKKSGSARLAALLAAGFTGIFRSSSRKASRTDLKGRIAIRVNNPGVIPMLGKLPDALGRDRFFYYASDHLRFSEQLKKLGVLDLTGFSPAAPGALFQRMWKAAFSFPASEAVLLIKKYSELLRMVARYEYLCDHGISTILVNACENDGEGNIMTQVARRKKVRSANFMNGTKAFDIVNQNSVFDSWFMHEEHMQKLASSIYGIPEENLPVTGHLLEDVARSYRYSGMLDDFFGARKPQFIIAFFTSPLFTEENTAAYHTMLKFIAGKDDVAVLMKPHPREPNRPWGEPNPQLIRVAFEGKKVDNETVMFDMLSSADVAVSVASTVSYQASWFSIPSLTFELMEKSRLPHIDGEKVKHINDPSQLLQFLESCYAEKKANGRAEKNQQSPDSFPVASRMAAILNA